MPIDREWLSRMLDELHETVRATVERTTSPSQVSGVNRKGDVPESCDLSADHAIRCFLRQHFSVGVILSEEGDDEVVDRDGAYQFVIDPVDGTDNFRRALPSSTVCIAAIPIGQPIAVETVEWAMVGDYRSQCPAVAIRGVGAWHGAQRLSTSGITDVSQACLHFELNQHPPSRPLSLLMERAGAVRSYCSTAYALYLLAHGSMDAHVDVRKRVTPESYLAASLLLTEAGGMITDAQGERLPPFHGLTDRRNILAAATPQLARELAFLLNDC